MIDIYEQMSDNNNCKGEQRKHNDLKGTVSNGKDSIFESKHHTSEHSAAGIRNASRY